MVDDERLKALPSRRAEIDTTYKVSDGSGYHKEVNEGMGSSYQKAVESEVARLRASPSDPRVQVNAVGKFSGYMNNTQEAGKELCQQKIGQDGYVPGTIFLSFGKMTEQVQVKTGFFKKETQERPEAAENYVKGGGNAPAFYVNLLQVSSDDPTKTNDPRKGVIGKTMFMTEEEGQRFVQELKSNLENKDLQQRQAYAKSLFSDVMKNSEIDDPKGNLAKNVVMMNVDNIARYSNTSEVVRNAKDVRVLKGTETF